MFLRFLVTAAALSAQSYVETVAGTGWIFPSTPGPALQAPLAAVQGIVADANGNLYVADFDNHIVVKIDTRGILSVFAGNGLQGLDGDGAPATQAELDGPSGLAFDPQGNLLIVAAGSGKIRRVDRAGIISTIAGGGANSNDGAAALAARIDPWSIAIDTRGIIYFSEPQEHRVRQIDANGIVRTVAGTGTAGFSGDGGLASQARIDYPFSIAFDAAGNLYIADNQNHRIRRVRPNGNIDTFAGNGETGLANLNGPATRAQLSYPETVYADRQGNIFIGDARFDGRILRVDASGVITRFAGGGRSAAESGSALDVYFNNPRGLVVTPDGALFVTESNGRSVRRVLNGNVTLFAGNGRFRFTGDGGPATAATLNFPEAMAFAPDGTLYFLDTGNYRVRKIRPDGVIETVAGTGKSVLTTAPTQARSATFSKPAGLALDPAGNLYVSEFDAGIVHRISPAGLLTPFVTASSAFPQGTAQKLGFPGGMVTDAAGNLYVADGDNHLVRRVTPAGVISNYAGTGEPGFSGDGQDAIRAKLHYPRFLAIDPAGNLFIRDTESGRVRKVTRNGVITTVAGNGSASHSGDGGLATAAGIEEPRGIAVDAQGNLFIASLSRIRVVDGAGIIRPLAGGPSAGNTGDGGPPSDAFIGPSELALGRNGELYFSQYYDGNIRAIRSASPTYGVTPPSLSFTALAGANQVSATLELRASTAALAYTARATGGSWLTVSPEAGVMPGQLTVSARTDGLAPGAYNGRIEIGSPRGNPTSTAVAVTLTVTATGPKLSVTTQSLNFSSLEGGPSNSATLRVANEGSGNLDFQASAILAEGERWLTVSPPSGTVAAGAFTPVTVAASPSGLRTGTYSASVAIVSGNDRFSVGVTMLITAASAKILLSQTGLTFTAVAGGGQPLPQTFAVLNEGSGTLNFTAAGSTFSGANWLTVTPRATTVQRPLLDLAEIDVAVDHRGLSAGDYYGQARISATGAGAPQTVTVVLRVLPEGSNPGPDLQPSGIIFTAVQGVTPGSQEVSVINLLGRDVSFASGSVTFDGAAWMKHLPTNAGVAPNEPRRIVVQPDFARLAPGIRRGVITLVFNDGTIRTVSALSIVAPAGANPESKDGNRQAASCATPRLNVAFTQINEGSAAKSGQPFSIEARVVDDCGNPLRGNEPNANSFVSAKFDNGDPDLRLTPLGDGRWTGTWRPLNQGGGRVTISGIAAHFWGLTNVQAGRVDRQISLLPASGAPVILAGAVVHGASQRGDVPIAPGSLVTLYGTNLSERTTGLNALPLPTEKEGTEVLLGGQPLPILFASPAQINAQLPFNLPSNAVLQIVVRRNAQISVPESFVVAPAQPGIFTKNQQGTGQGIVVRSDQVTLAEPGAPARRGEAVVIYGTGLGPVNQIVTAGNQAPSSPLAVTLSTVEVLIGGKSAQVLFSGLTPGFAGLYQVNAILPADSPTGNAVPLSLRVDGRLSNSVEIAVE